MGEDQRTRDKEAVEEISLRIDYENIDVGDIMAQIKERIAARPPEPEEAAPSDLHQTGGVEAFPVPPEEPSGIKARLKRLLLKILRPFAPVIKLAIFPVYQEFRQMVQALDQTNRRLDFLYDHVYRDVREAIDRVDRKTVHNMANLNNRIDLAFEDLNPTLEYTKLLHSLSHNLVVELTKLKIEHENLKLKARILEKDFEFLGQREKALEGHVFK